MQKHASLTKYGWLLGVIIVVSILTSFYQIFTRQLLVSQDSAFNYNRFWDAMRQLQTSRLNYFQTNFAFNQTGRITNAALGPAFAFLQGQLLTNCHSWLSFQVWQTLLVNLVGGTGFYLLLRDIETPAWLSLTLLVPFLSLNTAADFSLAWALALAPWLLRVLVRLLTNQKDPLSWYQFALTFGLAGQINLGLAAWGLLFFVICLSWAIIKSDARKVFAQAGYGLAALLVLLAVNLDGLLVLINNEASFSQSNVSGALIAPAIFVIIARLLRGWRPDQWMRTAIAILAILAAGIGCWHQLSNTDKIAVPAKTEQLPMHSTTFGLKKSAGQQKSAQQEIITREKKFSHKVLANGNLQLTWQAKKAGPTSLPLTVYQESVLSINEKKIKAKTSAIGAPVVHQQSGNNKAVLSFKAPHWFASLGWLTAISWLWLFAWPLILRRNKKRE